MSDDAPIVHEHADRTFYDSVAYMPVPRCDTCKHWDVDTAGNWDAHRCLFLSQDFCCNGRYVKDPADESKWLDLPPDFNAGATAGGEVETRPDFGCVQWEAKPVTSPPT